MAINRLVKKLIQPTVDTVEEFLKTFNKKVYQFLRSQHKRSE